MEFLQSADFWIGLVKIVWINIILSGDNAVVIALAARSLPPHQQKKAVFWGSGAAVVLRILLTVVAAKLLELSFLQIVGGCLLLWIGFQLLSDDEEEEGQADGTAHAWYTKASAQDQQALNAAIDRQESNRTALQHAMEPRNGISTTVALRWSFMLPSPAWPACGRNNQRRS